MQGYSRGAIWPAEDIDSIEIREVYARYGLAMSQAQVLEHGMVNTVMVMRLLPTMTQHGDRTEWEAAFDRFYDDELAKTFGNMLQGIATLPDIPTRLMDRLRAAKERRDHLAHRFFREHDIDFMSPPGRTAMIAECEDLIELFTDVDRAIENWAAPQRERYGITKKWIEERVAEAQREANARGA
jgi:hypothetical protein